MLKNTLKKFLRNTSGNIAPIAALMLVPIVVTAGAAVDYANFTNVRSDIQNAIDAASVATAKEMTEYTPPEGLTDPDAIREHMIDTLAAYAATYAKANINPNTSPDSYEISFNLVADPDDPTNEQIEVTSSLNYKTIFGGIGITDNMDSNLGTSIETDLTARVALGNQTVEIALVLDNSGSMAFKSGDISPAQPVPAPQGQRRINVLEEEAQKLVDEIYNAAAGSQLPKPVQFSLVPFSTSVNVGNLDHENHKNGNNFLDKKGYAPSHNENFDWLNTYRAKSGESVTKGPGGSAILNKSNGSSQYLTRFDVFDMMNTEWEGCVEMRPWPHNVRDTYGNANAAYKTNRAKKLFVPYLVPDAPDPIVYNYYSNAADQIITFHDNPSNGSWYYSNNYLVDYFDYDADGNIAVPTFQNDDLFGPGDTLNVYNNNQIKRSNWLWKYQAIQGASDATINAIPNNSFKNRQLRSMLQTIQAPQSVKNTNTSNSSYFADSGPNSYCPDQPIVQLTDDKEKIKSELEGMEAHGGTNIHQGLTWGWRTLSKAKPFTGGRDASDPNNLKILILLTDGNNQMLVENNPNNTPYTAWGFQRDANVLKHPISNENTHARLLDGANETFDTIYESEFTIDSTPDEQTEYEDLMNLHTNQACNNIKNDGVTIISIAFDVPPNNPQKPQLNKVRKLLEACSGSGKLNGVNVVSGLQLYHDVSGSELQDTFAEISKGISALRLTK